MLRVYGCIASEHRPGDIVFAVAICLLSMATAFILARHIDGLKRTARKGWILLVGFVTGVGIWATHFIAILAYAPGLPTAYAPLGTVVSAACAIAMSWAAWTLQFSRGRHAVCLATGTMTLGIAAMHLVGMSALQTQGRFDYDPVFLGEAVFAAGLACLAGFSLQRGRLPRAPAAQTILLASAICVLHFGAMTAVTIVPDPRVTIAVEAVSRDVLTIGVGAAVLILIGLAVFAIVLDVRVKSRVAELAYTLSRDPLTGLLNAPAFEREAAQVLGGADGQATACVLVHVVCDGIGDVIADHGRKAGNLALQSLARRLETDCGQALVGRLSAEQFAVLFPCPNDPESVAGALQTIEQHMSRPLILDGQTITVAARSGAACYPSQAADWDDLGRKAGCALHHAEFTGARTTQMYDPSLERLASERHRLESALREAVAGSQLALHYQPIACLQTGGVIGFEALMRWHHPELGNIPPARFVPLAEAAGYMAELGNWALRTACAEAAGWVQPLKVAVNLSPAQFADGGLVASIRSALADSGLPPGRLELEITEGLFIEEGDEAVEILREIKALGVKIAMDDFGTGFSSLAYFRRFPFDKVKIDQSFIRDMIDNRQSMAVVRAVIALGHALDLIVLAEGVETAQQHDVLAIEGCDQVQGYAIGRAEPAERFVDLTGRMNTRSHPCTNRCEQCLERLRPPCQPRVEDRKPFYVSRGGGSMAA